MKITQLLSVRLFLLLLAVMVVVFTVHTYVVIHVQRRHLMESVLLSAHRLSDVIRSSTRYGMLLNRREDVHQIIKTVGNEPGIDGIRIYNKKGEIMFSTIPGEQKHTVDMKAEACYACHSQTEPIRSLPMPNRSRIFTSSAGHRVLGLINPIRNEPECYNAACHAHPPSKTILGVLDVKVSLKHVDEHLAASRRQLITSSALMTLVIAIVSGGFIWLVVRIPVKKLTIGTREIASGNLDYTISVHSTDEIGRLAESFNEMTRQLKQAREEITRWSQTLEDKVREKAEELKRVQDHLIQMEKMASLGKLSATVAHEINNPLAGILTYTKLVTRQLQKDELTPEERASLQNYLSLIHGEVARCGSIVKNLLVFAKRTGGEFRQEHLNSIIEKSLQLVDHHLELQGVKLEKVLAEDDDVIFCDPEQLQQALLAIFTNAAEAMPSGGTLKVSTQRVDQKDILQIRIKDTGVGIPPDVMPHIFEPFFTTKKDTKSVGLGLAVVYGIVERHGGQIEVESEVGQGTAFIITLPRNLPSPAKPVKANAFEVEA